MAAALSASLHRRCSRDEHRRLSTRGCEHGNLYRNQTAQPPAHFEGDQQSRRSMQMMIFSVHAPTRKNFIDAIAPWFLGCRTASERLEAAGVLILRGNPPSFPKSFTVPR
jgi:hypothetical protein